MCVHWICSVVPVVAELEERIRRGEKVYLHWCAPAQRCTAQSDRSSHACLSLMIVTIASLHAACSRGGVGRAGTIGACLLVYAFHVSAEDALDRVQRAYDTRGGSGRSNNPRSCVIPDPDRLHSRCRTINPVQAPASHRTFRVCK